MKNNTRKKGAYYLKKSIDYYKKLGWRTEKLEIPQFFFIGKKMVMGSRKDLLGADMCIWKDNEVGSFTLIQVKSGAERSVSTMQAEAKRQFAEWNVPLPKIIMIWQPNSKPIIVTVE